MYLFECSFDYGRYLSYCRFLTILLSLHPVHAFHILLDPAGDVKDPGRPLATCCERSVTLQLCELIAQQLQETRPDITVTITRTAGEARTQEQRAQIANQLMVDLCMHISCFEESALKPTVTIYYYDDHTQTMPYKPAPYTLIPAHKAHLIAAPKTKMMSDLLCKSLRAYPFYLIQGPYGIPDARLKGIMVPACTLEFGISRTIPWTHALNPFVHALMDAVICMG